MNKRIESDLHLSLAPGIKAAKARFKERAQSALVGRHHPLSSRKSGLRQIFLPSLPSVELERRSRARGLVDEIRDQALALGWTHERLYFSDGYDRRPLAAGYGLVCYVGTEERIGEVTRQSIELIGPTPTGARSRFYNSDVEQPWVKRTAYVS